MRHTYVAEYIPAENDQWRLGRGSEIYRGASLSAAKRACADRLGYRDIRSALDWTGQTSSGHDTLIFGRRREWARGAYTGGAVALVYADR